jgi:hypothetical protein
MIKTMALILRTRVLLLVALAAMFVGVTVTVVRPPSAVPSSAPPQHFASGRAMEVLRSIASEPRPIGSAGNRRALDTIMNRLTALGVDASVEERSSVCRTRFASVNAGTVRNIVAIVPGVEPGPMTLLVAHYDSVARGPGAADNGAGVAALLEVLRALKAGVPPTRSVMALFSDGEEDGLLGGCAFAADEPRLQRIGLVVNLEARGTRGPSIMFETSQPSEGLIQLFARASAHPISNSALGTVYDALPNDTDLTVFKRAGIPGLNFAFIEGDAHYHTSNDSLENLDERSLQHHGEQALGIVRAFGTAALAPRANVVYFDLLGKIVVYSSRIAMACLAAVLLLVAAAAVRASRSEGLRPGPLIRATLSSFLAIVGAVVVVTAVWMGLTALNSATEGLHSFDTWMWCATAGTVVAAAGSTAAFQRLMEGRLLTADERMGGALIVSGLLAVLATAWQPQVSYLVVWPLAGSALVWLVRSSVDSPALRELLTFIQAIPAALVMAPLVYLVMVALPPAQWGAGAVLVGIVTTLIAPSFDTPGGAREYAWKPLALASVVGFVACALPAMFGSFDAERPRQNHLFYALDADRGEAIWGSADATVDDWTRARLGAAPQRQALPSFILGSKRTYLVAKAPVERLEGPSLRLSKQVNQGSHRLIEVELTAPTGAASLALFVKPDAKIVACSLLGQRVTVSPSAPLLLRYANPPPGPIVVTFEATMDVPLELLAVSETTGLPGDLPPRPPTVVPSMSRGSDQTLVLRRLALPGGNTSTLNP